jgi:hypothetical protein
VSENGDLSGGDPNQVADGVDQRRLASPVGTEQAKEFAGPDVEVELPKPEGAVVITLFQPPDRERWLVSLRNPSSMAVPDP